MSRVSRNIFYNGVGQGLSVLLGFVAVRFVFRRLGGDALGLIYFSTAFSAALSVAAQLGICESAVREVASHHGSRPEYIKSFIRTSSLLYWISYLALAVVAYMLAPYLVNHWIKLDSLGATIATKSLRILTLGALAALPSGLYKALLVGLQHMGITNLIDVGGKALQQGGIFLILLAHGSLMPVAYWIAASTALPVVIYWLVCTRYFSLRALLLPGFSLSVVKENIGYAKGLITISLCAWALSQADKVVVSKLLPLTVLGMYTVARGAINQGMLLTGAINNAIFPHFSALHGAGKPRELKRAYKVMHDLICFGTVPVFAAVPFAVLPVFSRMLDMPSARLLLLPATFLCVGYYMNGTVTAPYVVSLAVGRPDIAARQNVVGLFVVLPASAVAIYFLGLNGAGLSWVIYHIFVYSYGLPRMCRECLGMAPRLWYWHVLRIMGSAFLIYGSIWGLIAWRGNFSDLTLVAGYVLATGIYSVLAFQMMNEELRETILGFVSSLGLKAPEVTVPQ